MKKLNDKNVILLLLFFLSAAIVLVITIISINMMNRSAEMVAETSSKEMLAFSKAAALLVAAEELDEYKAPEDKQKEGYLELNKKLIAFTEEAGLDYTYYLRLDTDTNMMQFIIDNSPVDTDNVWSEGTALTFELDREEAPDYVLGTGNAKTVELGSYSEGWGGYLTAYAPVYYSDGTQSNILAGVDMKDVYIQEAQSNTQFISLILGASLLLVLATSLMCLFLYRNKARQAEGASASKSIFLSNMSHEMRTPMNAIIGMTEIAKGSDDPERVRYCLAKIDDAANHLLGVINDVLDISKIEAGKLTITPSEFLMENMLQRLTTVIAYKVDEKSQSFVIKVDRDVPDSVFADQQRLTQVIANLLSNAVKFTPENGKISLLVHKEDEHGEEITLKFEVTDNGIGIPQERQDALFQSFVQADNSIFGRFGGTGLGLAISKSIVEQMGGRIWVESEIGEGSTFIFTCKVKKGTQSSNLAIKNKVNMKDISLLVVDDAPEILEYFADIAQRIGASCDTALGAGEALKKLEENQSYQMIFVDYVMPDINGIEFTKRVREKYGENSFVIMISGTQWAQIEDEARAAGVDHYLAKPLFPSMVVDCINKCLGKEAYEVQTAESENIVDGIFAGKRILLAEDMAINREIMGALLEGTGLELIPAEDGSIAVEKFKESPDSYDLIFMDIHMPELDGYQATKQIRALPIPQAPMIPIIAMTANVFREDIERCLDAGMNDHLGKPINLDEVIEKLKKYL